jgi:hypothetical protein
MSTTTSNPVFDFDDLNALWNRVKDLKPNEHLQVRRPDQGAQGAINEIKADLRFKDFTTYNARHTKPFEATDTTLFTIYKTPKRHRSDPRA